MTLEELFQLEVNSVSKKEERLSETAADVHVVTDEDIRRSGALSIPEALRCVPGIEVARVDARQYAITARGFNGTAANKLLVLMDGRSIYTSLFSGVFWDAQNTFLDDVSRIEVVRGPGATVWGANAVNGVINVITKSAAETHGLLVTTGGGFEEKGFVGLRYGARVGPGAHVRVYGKHFDRDDSELPDGRDAGDHLRITHGGFRLDWDASTSDLLTFQGDVQDGAADQPTADDIAIDGGHLLARWTRRFSDASEIQVQTYYDRTDRDIPPTFGERLDVFDVEVRHRFPLVHGHDFTWGAGYWLTEDDVENSPMLAFLPGRLTQRLLTGFVQDEVTVVADRLKATVGTKVEENDYTGFEYQPGVRLAFMPSDHHTLWAATSRAIRAPSRIDRH